MYKTAGIYKIENKKNGKIYIGESLDIAHRWENHWSDLESKSHANKKLQSDYDLYGKEAFVFSVIQSIENNTSVYKKNMELIILENKYINTYNSIEMGYNIENTLEKYLLGEKCFSENKERDMLYIFKHLIIERLKNGFKDDYEKLPTQKFNRNNYLNFYELVKHLYLTGHKYSISEVFYLLITVGILVDKNTFNDEFLTKGLFENIKRSCGRRRIGDHLSFSIDGANLILKWAKYYNKYMNYDLLKNKAFVHKLASVNKFNSIK